MGYEVDFLKVGEEGSSGDAIPLRYGDLHSGRSSQFVVVVDGGFKETGPDVVEFVTTRYGTRTVDLVISTHPHRDHAAGLAVVLEQLDVRLLLMHKPWAHADDVCTILQTANPRWTVEGVRSRLRDEFPHAVELESIAEAEGISIEEPFQGVETLDTCLTILGPSYPYYVALLAEQLGGPSAEADAPVGFIAQVLAAAKRVIRRMHESWDQERLEEPGPLDVTPVNRSSVITLLTQEDRRVLLTADAGAPSVERAADFADNLGVDLASTKMIQIAHHGSKRNVGPSLLNRIVGPILSEDETNGRSAIVSAAKDGKPTHPSGRVVNALVRRGSKVLITKDGNIWHHHDAPERSDYHSLSGEPFHESYDEEE